MSNRVKIEMEFEMKSSPAILYNYISGASGLSEWFAEKVNVKGNKNMVFVWGYDEREAEILKNTPKKAIKFRWLDEQEKSEYWEFQIKIDELTNDLTLVVIDFSDIDEEESVRQLWASQIEDLKSSIGA